MVLVVPTVLWAPIVVAIAAESDVQPVPVVLRLH
jgi:hypothetical protein